MHTGSKQPIRDSLDKLASLSENNEALIVCAEGRITEAFTHSTYYGAPSTDKELC